MKYLQEILAEQKARQHPLKKAFRQGEKDEFVSNERDQNFQARGTRDTPHRDEMLNDKGAVHYGSKGHSKDHFKDSELRSLRSKRKGDAARAYKAGREHERSGNSEVHHDEINHPLRYNEHGFRNGHPVKSDLKQKIKNTNNKPSANDNKIKPPSSKDSDYNNSTSARDKMQSLKTHMQRHFVKTTGGYINKRNIGTPAEKHLRDFGKALHKSKFSVVKNDKDKDKDK